MSSDDLIRTSILSTTVADPKEDQAPYHVDLDGTIVQIHQANMVFVGSHEREGQQAAVSLTCARGCFYGCGGIGRGFEYTPTPEQARTLARQLIDAADAVDAAAKAAARDLIVRARRP